MILASAFATQAMYGHVRAWLRVIEFFLVTTDIFLSPERLEIG
jgi:hypothetical protein